MAIRSAEPALLSVLRIVAGFLFLCHGVQKALGLYAGAHLPPLLVAACILETIGGLLILVGLFAFILSGEMAVGYFTAHFPRGFLPLKNGGESAVVFCFIFLYLFAAGAGPWSLDRVLRHK
jgi:putative oxidoreductase